MNQDLIHVYFMPGMAANPSIFEYVNLPKERFKVHLLEWKLPKPNETLKAYAQRMCTFVTEDNVVLLGVSFGGILVQEMSAFVNAQQVIVVSSVKTKYELPRRMKLAKATKAYKMLPTQLLGNVELLAKYAFGETATKRVELYKKYLSVSDKVYLDWAIEQIICWDRETVLPKVVHIHGDKDAVFPYQYITDCITVKNGTHVMIINKYKWFNENLPKIILEHNVA